MTKFMIYPILPQSWQEHNLRNYEEGGMGRAHSNIRKGNIRKGRKNLIFMSNNVKIITQKRFHKCKALGKVLGKMLMKRYK